MEIKILCPCGAKFKFDVEPVNGESPGAVSCPVCGADSTVATNALIAQQLAASVRPAPAVQPISVSPAAAPASSASSAPNVSIPAVRIPTPAAGPAPIRVSAPAAATGAAPISPKMVVMPVPESGRALSVKPPGEASAHEAPAPAAPSNAAGDPKAPGSPKMAFMPAPAAGTGSGLSVAGAVKIQSAAQPSAAHGSAAPVPAHPAAAKMVRARSSDGIRLKAGYTGAIIGTLIGMAIWYFSVITSGYEWKFLAVVVGVCAGGGARLLGRGKHPKLATVSGVSAIVGILAAQFLAIAFVMAEFVDELVETSYKERITLAREAKDARTDEQIREVMVKDSESEFESANQIDAADIAEYRRKQLPELVKFASGSPSRTQYEANIRKEIDESGLAKYDFHFMTIAWIAAGVAAAWKMVKPGDD